MDTKVNSIQHMDCVICKLLSGELEVSLVYEDDVCSALMDIQPINTGHVLVVPRRHAAHLAELDAEDGAQMFRVAQRVAAALRRCDLKCEGVNFFLADGEAAGQEVFHVHLHVFPRYAGDGFGLKFPPGYQQRPSREELNEIAEAIGNSISSITNDRQSLK
jgi:histidine triad (HIT) family protein